MFIYNFYIEESRSDILTVLQGFVILRNVYGVLPECSSLEWTYSDTSQKLLEEYGAWTLQGG